MTLIRDVPLEVEVEPKVGEFDAESHKFFFKSSNSEHLMTKLNDAFGSSIAMEDEVVTNQT